LRAYLIPQISIFHQSEVYTPERKQISSPLEEWPRSFIEVSRDENGRAKISCPKKWKNLSYLIYLAISEDGRMLIGRTENFENRLRGYERELTKGKRSLGEAWQKGQRVFFSVFYLCSTYETARQNETSIIVAYKTNKQHNRNVGNGSQSIDFGSPLKNGGGGRLREDMYKPLAEYYRQNLKPITDLENIQPKKWCKLDYYAKGDYIEVKIPRNWNNLISAIYAFEVDGQRYIGETGHQGKRLSSHLSNINGNATNSNEKLPQSIRNAIMSGREVLFTVFGVCNPTKILGRKQHEARLQRLLNTVGKHGLNGQLSNLTDPDSPLYEPPSPDKTEVIKTMRGLRKISCDLMSRFNETTMLVQPAPAVSPTISNSTVSVSSNLLTSSETATSLIATNLSGPIRGVETSPNKRRKLNEEFSMQSELSDSDDF
jgi:predicted GIY-YIG superfamily endonuclease